MDSSPPLRILVNASSLKVSGARHVALNVIRELTQRSDVAQVHALVPDGRGYDILIGPKLVLHKVPARWQASAAAIWRTRMLRKIAREKSPAFTINLANIPVRNIPNQFVLIHLPHLMHYADDVRHRLPIKARALASIKRQAFRSNLSEATAFWVQTEAARKDLFEQYGVPSEVMENAVDASVATARVVPISGDCIKLLTLSHYFPHKNLEVIRESARLARDRNIDVVFRLTLDARDKGSRRFLESMSDLIEDGTVENLGLVSTKDIPQVFADSTALFLPTLLESFSTTYVESMSFGRPIITSDRGFARSVCQDAAIYVDPIDPASVVEGIQGLGSMAVRDRLVAAGRRRLASFPNWAEVTDRMVRDALAKRSPLPRTRPAA